MPLCFLREVSVIVADPGPSPNAAEIMASVNDALQGLELEPHETSGVLGFANQELPHLHTPEDSYFVLGSYRDPYLRRLRVVQNELDRLITAASKNGIDLTKSALIDRLDDRDDAPISYSWVHLNEFRLFELHGRCLAWSTPADLRDVIEEIP